MKLAILAFLCCEDFVKTPAEGMRDRSSDEAYPLICEEEGNTRAIKEKMCGLEPLK